MTRRCLQYCGIGLQYPIQLLHQLLLRRSRLAFADAERRVGRRQQNLWIQLLTPLLHHIVVAANPISHPCANAPDVTRQAALIARHVIR